MSAIPGTGKIRREAVDAVIDSSKVQLIYRPETHTMAEVVAAINAAAASGEAIYLGPGNFDLNINLTTGSRGFAIIGAGRNKTFIRGVTADTPAFITKGLWYSTFHGFSISCLSGNTTGPVWDIDAEIGVLGIQGNTFSDLTIDARGVNNGVRGDYGIAMCRTATNSGQGSENLFLNCHFIGASEANYYQIGYNALQNTFIGGNFQNYTKHGMLIIFGSIQVLSVGFQSVAGITQIDNDGWDIRCSDGGVGDGITVIGCRTESIRFFLGNAAQPPLLISCLQRVALSAWAPNTAFTAGVGITHPDANNVLQLYRVLQNFTSGASFVVGSDLELVTFNVIESIIGKELNCNWQLGNIGFYKEPDNGYVECTTAYSATYRDKCIMMDCSGSSFDIGLYDPLKLPAGFQVVVTRADNVPANVGRVYSPNFDNTADSYHELFATTAGRSQRFMVAGFGFTRRWYRVD